MTYSFVNVEREGPVTLVTINRPEARNAFNFAVAQGLADAMDELDDSNDLSVAIVTGAGGTFCAGMDLKALDDRMLRDVGLTRADAAAELRRPLLL